MTKPLNPEKSKKLRPLRIVLAVLTVILVILILDRLPTSVKDRDTSQNQNQSQSQTTTKRETPAGAKYYYLNGFLELLEEQIEDRLKQLGVPKEEYQNFAEYLSKDEIFVIETKATLAANLESVYVEVEAGGLEDLRKIFDLGDDYDFDQFQELAAAPSEYKILADLLADYHKTLNTTEDYDIIEE